MNTYIKINSDGYSVEGIGATVQYQIICYALSRILGINYLFNGFKNINHYQHYGLLPSEWDAQINDFFNFPMVTRDLNLPVHQLGFSNFTLNDNVVYDLELTPAMKIADSIIDKSSAYFNELKNNIRFDVNKYYFDKNILNISVHIRKYTSTDNDNNVNRELFDVSKKTYYLNLIKFITDTVDKLNIKYCLHIYSQGMPDDYIFIENELGVKNIKYHVEEHPLTSIYHLIHSDILVCSNSSFSYISHLLNTNAVILARPTFFHKWKNDSILIDDSGFFNINEFRDKLVERYERNN